VPSKAKPLTPAQLRAYESKRDLAAELLESIQQMKAGKTSGLSQAQFAALLGVSLAGKH
jgi:putative transcriptional regulator